MHATASPARGPRLLACVENEQAALLSIEEASSPFRRLIGLLGRRSLAEAEGMLFRSCSSVHTFGMRFAIDVVYLDGDGLVVKVVRNLKPWRMSAGGRRAKDLVELAAGEATRTGIEPGLSIRMHS